jgi:polyisoprenoid-binding protein YceI
MTTCFRVLPVVLALAGAGCATHPAHTEKTPVREPAALAAGEGRAYEVQAADSLLTVLVYRGGTLARAGHNHVIASHDLSGTVYVPEDLTRASFELRFPVAALTVDEPTLRAGAGADFPPGVPESAREGTRRNMLSAALLDAEHFPEIVMRSKRVDVFSPDGLQAQVELTVRDRTHTVTVPIRYEWNQDRLTATGEVALKQSDLGLTPFSVMLGALQVLDELQIRFRISCRAAIAHFPAAGEKSLPATR